MTNRFSKKKNIFSRLPRFKFSYIICVAFIVVFLYGLSAIENTTIHKQQESLETALSRNITHCYAVEGYYPPSLAYLEKHYGLTYDKTLFFVDYRPIASNIRPNVTILLKEATS